jgi:hypothetical protein
VWPFPFIAAVVSALVVLFVFIMKRPNIRNPFVLLLAAFGLYVPFAFAFSQAVCIHPYEYDLYLYLACVLVLFQMLPAILELAAKHKGCFVFLSLMTAFCYSMTQIRTYAVCFPLK